jgi:hypothetical protein
VRKNLSERMSGFTFAGCVVASFSLLTVLVEATPAAAEIHIEQGDVKSGWIGRSMPAVIAERVGAYRIIEILSPGQGKDLGSSCSAKAKAPYRRIAFAARGDGFWRAAEAVPTPES